MSVFINHKKLRTLFCSRCSCPDNHEGPRCQQTSRGFRGKGWAWYPGLRACTPTHLSLEFLTEKGDGLLLYNGPTGPPNSNAALLTGKP